MMTLLDKTQMIRLHIQGKSNREIGRIMHVSRNTVNKYLSEYKKLQSELEACDPEDTEEVRRITDAITAEPAYDSSSRGSIKWNAEMDALLDEILESEDEKRRMLGPNKQALTKRQIHELIVAEGHDIGLTTVSRRIDDKRSAGKDAFVAQRYEYGDRFEYDFGEVKLYIGGRLRRIQMAVMVACASDVRFALLYENQRQDVFLDSQVRFFEFMGGTFREGVYDNMRNVVTKFIGKNEKELNPELVKLAAYYRFDLNVTNCFAGWEKGAVESAVKVVRNAAFALDWRFDTLADAQAHLDTVLAKLNEGKDIEAERRALRPLPPRYEVADVREGCRVDKYSCVTVDGARYSVPEELVGKRATVRVYPNEVLVDFGGANVAWSWTCATTCGPSGGSPARWRGRRSWRACRRSSAYSTTIIATGRGSSWRSCAPTRTPRTRSSRPSCSRARRPSPTRPPPGPRTPYRGPRRRRSAAWRP